MVNIMQIMSFNLNGIRAAVRKGLHAWLEAHPVDIICVQETKAQMNEGLGQELQFPGYTAYYADAQKKGYSGVGILTRRQPLSVKTELGYTAADEEGRYIELDFGTVRVVSLYLPSGTSGDERQAVKMRMLDWFYTHYLSKRIHEPVPTIICGDWNIAHRPEDLKNWRQNQKNSGFLPEERQWLDLVLTETGWVDAYRQHHPDKTEYTWWTYRGGARANNVGWRIDYQVVSPDLRDHICEAYVLREPVFSDHAPLFVRYDFAAWAQQEEPGRSS